MDDLSVTTLTYERVAKTIDHSLLRPELDLDAVLDRLRAGPALRRGLGTACGPATSPWPASALAGSDVLVGTVIGFPHGSPHHGGEGLRERSGPWTTAPSSSTWC